MPHTLLLADDSVTIQRVIELTFADEDIQVVAVSDGDKAIEHLNANPTDIVLADIGMPGKNGYEVAQYIRQSPRLQHIPVVLLRGAFEPVDQERANVAGCDGVLAKPFEPHLVIGRVKELLARSSRKGEVGEPAPAVAAQLPAAPAPSTNDYFDKLDAAFATLTSSPAKAPSSSDLPHVAAPTPANLDWFASQLNKPAAPAIARAWDLPGQAATSAADDVPLTTPEETAVNDLTLNGSGAEVPQAGAEVDQAGAEVLGAEVPGAVPGAEVQGAAPEDSAAPETAKHAAPLERPQHEAPQHETPQHEAPEHSATLHSAPHQAPSPPAPQHPIALPSLSDAFAALLAAEQNEPHPTAVPVWPVAGTSLPTPAPAPSPAPPPIDPNALVDEVTRRVLDRLADSMLRDAVADLTSAVAERLVREEIERIKSSIK